MNTRLNLVTYNLCKGGSPGYGTWAALFDKLAPDIFLAQESAAPEKYQAAKVQPFHRPPGSDLCWEQAGTNDWGSAVFARTQPVTPMPPLGEFAGWVMGAAVAGLPTPGDSAAPLHIYSVHTPRQPRHPATDVVGKILDCIRAQSAGAEVVIGGDFNITISARQPGEEQENSAAEKELFERLRMEFGLINCWQTAHPNTPLARTLRHRHNPDSLPYHNDGLFVPAAWGSALCSCEVLEIDPSFGELPSDHHVVQAIFEYDSAVS